MIRSPLKRELVALKSTYEKTAIEMDEIARNDRVGDYIAHPDYWPREELQKRREKRMRQLQTKIKNSC